MENGESISSQLPIKNTNRSVGAMLSGAIAKRFGDEGLPTDSITFKFSGSAGQSFGEFLARGVTMILEGDANDHVGKGLSGGTIAIFPPKQSKFRAEENVIAGNVIGYGATAGELYIRGVVGERFCVRNSGASAVVEGVGDHGCEYMTGGRVVVIGPTGRNFAAEMSGGIAYVYDETRQFKSLCNTSMCELELPDEIDDAYTIKRLLETHVKLTGSTRAKINPGRLGCRAEAIRESDANRLSPRLAIADDEPAAHKSQGRISLSVLTKELAPPLPARVEILRECTPDDVAPTGG